MDAFNSRLNMGLMNRPCYSVSYVADLFIFHSFITFFFAFIYIIDATLLITLVTFGLKFAYRVHTQPWLLNNLNHWSRIYFTTSTVQQKFSPKLEIFSTLFLFSWLCYNILIKLNQSLSVGTEFQPPSITISTWHSHKYWITLNYSFKVYVRVATATHSGCYI